MNDRIKKFEKQSGIEIYGLGKDKAKWDLALEKFAQLMVEEMCGLMEQAEDDCYSLEPSERPTEYIEWLYD